MRWNQYVRGGVVLVFLLWFIGPVRGQVFENDVQTGLTSFSGLSPFYGTGTLNNFRRSSSGIADPSGAGGSSLLGVDLRAKNVTMPTASKSRASGTSQALKVTHERVGASLGQRIQPQSAYSPPQPLNETTNRATKTNKLLTRPKPASTFAPMGGAGNPFAPNGRAGNIGTANSLVNARGLYAGNLLAQTEGMSMAAPRLESQKILNQGQRLADQNGLSSLRSGRSDKRLFR